MRTLCTIILAAVLAACATTETSTQPPAAVEDRAAGAAKPGAGPGASGVQEKPVTGVDLTAGKAAGTDPLRDPSSPLSARSIYYDFDKYDIKDEYKPVIEAHARYLRENGGVKMLIQGNTDERGSREYNVGLGQRRSDTVKRALVLLGAKEGQIESVSLGEEKPVCTDQAEGCWSKNRRDDMLYNGEY